MSSTIYIQNKLPATSLISIVLGTTLLLSMPAQATYYSDCDSKLPNSDYGSVYCSPGDDIYIAWDDDHKPQAMLNKQGKRIADLRAYDDIDMWISRDEGYFPVSKNNKVGYINTKGQLVIPIKYDYLVDYLEDKYNEVWANPVVNDRIVVRKNGKYGIINTENKVIMPFTNKYAFIDQPSEGMSLVRDHSYKIGLIDKNGKEVIAPKYEGSLGNYGGYYGFREGLVGMYDGKKWGFITKTGKVAVPFIYDEIRPFSEGLAGVSKNGKWGFINGANKTIIPFNYSDEYIIRNGLSYSGAFYFIFNDGTARIATINDENICINKSGKTVTCSSD